MGLGLVIGAFGLPIQECERETKMRAWIEGVLEFLGFSWELVSKKHAIEGCILYSYCN